MNKVFPVALLTVAAWVGTATPAPAKEKGKRVGYTVYKGYFQKNTAGLEGRSSYLTFTDRQSFDKVFGPAPILRNRGRFLPAKAFDTEVVVAVIKRGTSPWTYGVKSVRAEDGKLYVRYTATTKNVGDSARFASPLILAVDKGKYSTVVFIENNKRVGTADVGK
jgi:hypothetical protein